MRLSDWVKVAGEGSISELMRVCDVAWSTASNWCNGKQNPKPYNIEKICAATHGAVTLADLANNKRPRRRMAAMRKRRRRRSLAALAA
jgi:DNA-binding transcriptional regulator YdaS (Cro superfamily)